MDAVAITEAAKESQTPKSKAAVSHHDIRRNLSYLIDPASKENRPVRVRTRAALKTLRYVTIFVFWRLVRYVKYAVVGSLVAAVAGSALGPFMSGAAFLIAPPGILAFAGVGIMWGIAKFSWKTMARRVRHGQEGKASPRKDERADAGDV